MQQTSTHNKFGTAPVFFTAISTILGAIMFLRFGFAVGQVGFWGTMAIILIGHAVTIPTAMAIAEIATNQKVEGGGEYFIISRSFGLVIGSAIGIALYLSQAISVAFYIMAFAEAFSSLFEYLISTRDIPLWLIWFLEQKQTIGIPALLLLTYIMLTKGANLGVKALYVVVVTLAISLIAFFIGTTNYNEDSNVNPFSINNNISQNAYDNNDIISIEEALVLDIDSIDQTEQDDSISARTLSDQKAGERNENSKNPLIPLGFFTVFAIIFPAFTGMTAGVGLSGDLKNPGYSIPIGTLSATLFGMIVYIFIAYKLVISASPSDLSNVDHLIMADIAWQGWWLIPVGLAAATISSALGSIMVAPRTLQAIAKDEIFPTPKVNNWISKGRGKTNEPFNASVLTILIAAVFIMVGALDGVARIISMFFMVTYGSLCLISFLNHFAADPSYRPRFRSRWLISLFGAISCFGLMFFMNPLYAFLAVLMMIILYFTIAYYNQDKKSMALIFQGVAFQFSRLLHVFLQKADKEKTSSWRPSAVAFSAYTFERLGAFDLLRWISQRYGFGTYIHQIEGYLSNESYKKAKQIKTRLIKLAEQSKSNIYMDTLISPSYTSSIAQVIQLPGITGTDNNILLFEFAKDKPEELLPIISNFKLITSVDFDLIILGSSKRGYGLHKHIHIWITATDYQNANLMILLAYIIMGHTDWHKSEIKIFSIYEEDSIDHDKTQLLSLIEQGHLPIAPKNIEFIARKQDIKKEVIIMQKSQDADLTIVGFHPDLAKHNGLDMFEKYNKIGNVLFVHAVDSKQIK